MGKVFAVSDIHGQYDLFKQIKDFMKEDDICYVLGDCIDRGDKGIAILIDIIQDKRFRMLKGNHEQMMLEAFESMQQGYMEDMRMWIMNGGTPTYDELIQQSDSVQQGIMSFIRRLPIMLTYKDIVMTHAGYTYALEEHIDSLGEDMLLWDRSHLTSKAKSKQGKTQVHGHTPTPTIIKGHSGPLAYSEGKICIDTGAFFTGVAAILDLDTLQTHYFWKED